jgi:hypothetical protein
MPVGGQLPAAGLERGGRRRRDGRDDGVEQQDGSRAHQASGMGAALGGVGVGSASYLDEVVVLVAVVADRAAVAVPPVVKIP